MRSSFLMLLGLLCFGAPLMALGPFTTFTAVDQCGGQSAFIGTGNIVEESSGFCGSNAAGVVSVGLTMSGNYLVYYTGSLYGLQVGDVVFLNISGTYSPSCLTRPAGLGVAGINTSLGVVVLSSAACPHSGPVSGGSGGVFYAAYTNRYELNLVQQGGGSWVTGTAAVSLMSTGGATGTRTLSGIGATCSIGDPAGYFDGSHYYLAFTAQNSTAGNCGNGNSPGQGSQYDLWACYLNLPTDSLTPTNCGLILAANQSGGVGSVLDPQIFSNLHIYVSEKDNSTVLTALGSPAYDVWSVDDIIVNWTASPPAPQISPPGVHTYVFNPTGWSMGRNPASQDCEQYYKLTGLFNLPIPGSSPVVRAFFQADDINPDSTVSPFTNYGGVMPGSCPTLGATPLFSGIFYADLTTDKYLSTTVYTGAHYTQLYPSPAATALSNSCLTPSATRSNHCYGEFPWMLQSGTRMLVYANPDTPASIVDQCRMTTNCQTNFTTEIEQLLITADYSQSAAPMSVATAVPTSNMQNTGTANCQSLLSMDGTAADCGIFSAATPPVPLYGGCNHINVDEISGFVTCGKLTNFDNVNYKFLVRRTMVFPMQPSILNPVVQAIGPVLFTGGQASPPTGGASAYSK